jgi:hypothetical protein
MQLWRKLKRANAGSREDAKRVIHLTYGACGKIMHLKQHVSFFFEIILFG